MEILKSETILSSCRADYIQVKDFFLNFLGASVISRTMQRDAFIGTKQVIC